MDTSSRQSQSSLLQHASRWLPILALISLVLILWLPFGWQVGFYTDEWTTMRDIQAGAFITQSVRPFELVSWFTAYHINTANLYIGMNVLVTLLMIGKGILSFRLLSDMGLNKLFAFGTAVLVILYPADQGVFYLGAISIHASIFTYLLALWLLVRFWQSQRWWLWIPLALVTALCVGIYEGIYPLILLTPLILVYLQGGINRRVLLVSLLWLVVPFLFGLRLISILFLSSSANSYQSSLFANDHSAGTILASLWRILRYSLVDTWVSGAWQTFTNNTWLGIRNVFKTILNNPYLGYELAGIAVTIITSSLIAKQSQNTKSLKKYALLLGISPLMLILGFLLYSLTNLRDINVRTLLHASLGAALFISAGLWLVGSLLRKPAVIYTVAISFLMMIAIPSLLKQHELHAAAGQSQLPFMRTLVQAASGIEPQSTVIVFDETPDRELERLFRISYYFDAPVKVIYSDNSLSAVICYATDQQAWGPYNETCHFEADTFQWRVNDQIVRVSTYDHLVIFRYTANRVLSLETGISHFSDSEQAYLLYHPDRLIKPNGVLPLRAQTMLNLPSS